eukprot:m.1248557 g.1248557  ORF g.1248557 m.1248557 type:complete len:448 (+) comp24698_c0_seq34:350-1693(+)
MRSRNTFACRILLAAQVLSEIKVFLAGAPPFQIGGWPSQSCSFAKAAVKHNFTRCSDANSFNIFIYPVQEDNFDGSGLPSPEHSAVGLKLRHHPEAKMNGNLFWQHTFQAMAQYQFKSCSQNSNANFTDLCKLNFTSDPSDACLLIPTLQYDCYLNKCENGAERDQRIEDSLRALKSWDHGRNHILFTTSDFEVAAHDFSSRAHAGSDLRLYAACHDVSFPAYNIARHIHVHKSAAKEMYLQDFPVVVQHEPASSRRYLLTFKGSRYPYHGPHGDWCTGARIRDDISQLHDPTNGIVVVTKCKTWGYTLGNATEEHACNRDEVQYDAYDYDVEISNTTYALVPRGCGPSNCRLIEVLGTGAVPVILQDGVILPFAEWLDWSDFAIVVPERSVKAIPAILATISPSKLLGMQRKGTVPASPLISKRENDRCIHHSGSRSLCDIALTHR